MATTITTTAAVAATGLSRNRVTELARMGVLRGHKVGRRWMLDKADVTRYQRTLRPSMERAEDFDDTRGDHRGSVVRAARRLNITPEALARALYRARAAGWTGTFTDDRKSAA